MSSNVSASVGVADPHRRIPPHATLKSPFQTTEEKISQLKEKLNQFTTDKASGVLTINGFDHFNKRIVYLNLTANPQARNVVDSVTEMLKGIDWLGLDTHDMHVVLHSTIARARSDAEFESIWQYVEKNYTPNLEVSFDNIALLKLNRKNDNWTTVNEYKL